jgi:hypothetical protein
MNSACQLLSINAISNGIDTVNYSEEDLLYLLYSRHPWKSLMQVIKWSPLDRKGNWGTVKAPPLRLPSASGGGAGQLILSLVLIFMLHKFCESRYYAFIKNATLLSAPVSPAPSTRRSQQGSVPGDPGTERPWPPQDGGGGMVPVVVLKCKFLPCLLVYHLTRYTICQL